MLMASPLIDWIQLQTDGVNERETNDVVQRLFELQGFMPLPLKVTSDWGEGVGLAKTEEDAVVEAIVYNHELAAAALRNGEFNGLRTRFIPLFSTPSPSGYLLTPRRTEQIINGWFDISLASSEVLESVKASCNSGHERR